MPNKFKLSPQEYNSILKGIRLDEIRLIEGKFEVNHDRLKGSHSGKVAEKSNFIIDKDNRINIFISYTLNWLEEKENKKIISIYTKFCLILKSEKEFTKEFFSIYKRLNLNGVTWPFFREYIFDITSRMYIKPIVLPLVRTK